MNNYYQMDPNTRARHDFQRVAGQGAQTGLRWSLLGGLAIFKAVFGFLMDMFKQLAGK